MTASEMTAATQGPPVTFRDKDIEAMLRQRGDRPGLIAKAAVASYYRLLQELLGIFIREFRHCAPGDGEPHTYSNAIALFVDSMEEYARHDLLPAADIFPSFAGRMVRIAAAKPGRSEELRRRWGLDPTEVADALDEFFWANPEKDPTRDNYDLDTQFGEALVDALHVHWSDGCKQVTATSLRRSGFLRQWDRISASYENIDNPQYLGDPMTDDKAIANWHAHRKETSVYYVPTELPLNKIESAEWLLRLLDDQERHWTLADVTARLQKAEATVKSALTFLKNLDFLKETNGLYQLTGSGVRWINDPDPIAFCHQLDLKFAFIGDLLDIARVPITSLDAHEAARTRFGMDWKQHVKTTTQVNYRRDYLVAARLLSREGQVMVTTDTGSAFLTRRPQLATG